MYFPRGTSLVIYCLHTFGLWLNISQVRLRANFYEFHFIILRFGNTFLMFDCTTLRHVNFTLIFLWAFCNAQNCPSDRKQRITEQSIQRIYNFRRLLKHMISATRCAVKFTAQVYVRARETYFGPTANTYSADLYNTDHLSEYSVISHR